MGNGVSPGPLEGMRPCQHLNFKCLASRSVRESISVVLCQPACNLVWQPEDISISTDAKKRDGKGRRLRTKQTHCPERLVLEPQPEPGPGSQGSNLGQRSRRHQA